MREIILHPSKELNASILMESSIDMIRDAILMCAQKLT